MLHYKSRLLQWMSTLFFSLPLVLGFVEEKQHLSVLMMEDYYEPFVGEVDSLGWDFTRGFFLCRRKEPFIPGWLYWLTSYRYTLWSWLLMPTSLALRECFFLLPSFCQVPCGKSWFVLPATTSTTGQLQCLSWSSCLSSFLCAPWPCWFGWGECWIALACVPLASSGRGKAGTVLTETRPTGDSMDRLAVNCRRGSKDWSLRVGYM